MSIAEDWFNDPKTKAAFHTIKKANVRRRAAAFQKSVPPPSCAEFIRDFHGVKAYVLDSSTFASWNDHRGWGNGYVMVPPRHPWFKKWYDDVRAHVHGGLTYCQLEDGMWTVGFDTAHYQDSSDNCTKGMVIRETLSLMKQALKAQSNKKYRLKQKHHA